VATQRSEHLHIFLWLSPCFTPLYRIVLSGETKASRVMEAWLGASLSWGWRRGWVHSTSLLSHLEAASTPPVSTSHFFLSCWLWCRHTLSKKCCINSLKQAGNSHGKVKISTQCRAEGNGIPRHADQAGNLESSTATPGGELPISGVHFLPTPHTTKAWQEREPWSLQPWEAQEQTDVQSLAQRLQVGVHGKYTEQDNIQVALSSPARWGRRHSLT
jgi:hypothetical protein